MTTETDVRERPILFSAEMVRAILDGRKRQTRRVVKPQPPDEKTRGGLVWARGLSGQWGPFVCYRVVPERSGWIPRPDLAETMRNPYGNPGDRLYVREAFAVIEKRHEAFGTYREVAGTLRDYGDRERDDWMVLYRADGPPLYNGSNDVVHGIDRWRPSIHMPKWAARIWLEIVDVRVERVQDINARDAEAESIEVHRPSAESVRHTLGRVSRTIERFARLWDKLNAPRGFGWDVNPWVWALTFRRIER